MAKIINEDDFTRNFLANASNLLKEHSNKNLKTVITEEFQNNEQPQTQNEIVIDKSDGKLIELQNNITKFVGALQVDDKSEIVYPLEGDVVFSGVITDMNNLKFQFKYNDQSGGLYIWADSMLLTKEVAEKLAKLTVIREQWKDYWSSNISQYNQK